MSSKLYTQTDWWQRFVTENPVSQDQLDHFANIEWTNRLLRDPLYEAIPPFSRTLKPDGEDQFFAQTVNSKDTISHYVCLRRKDFDTLSLSDAAKELGSSTDPKAPLTPPAKPDCNFLLATSKGLDGHPGIMHGGMCCAILDETIGLMILMHVRRQEGSQRQSHAYTIYLNTRYRAQVPTSEPILIRTWLAKTDGRKWLAMGQIVDKNGTVCTEAECLYLIVPKEKL